MDTSKPGNSSKVRNSSGRTDINTAEVNNYGAIQRQSTNVPNSQFNPTSHENGKITKPSGSKKKTSKKKNFDDFMYNLDDSPNQGKKTASSNASDTYSSISSKRNSYDNLRSHRNRASFPSCKNEQMKISNDSVFHKVQTPEVKVQSKTPNQKSISKKQTPKTPITNRKSQFKFEPYIPLFQVQQGLKRGEFIEGALRINPRNYEDAYVNSPDGKMDIYIGGMHNRNRALNGDNVVVQINPKQEWKILCDAIKDYQEKSGESVIDSNSSRVESPPCKIHSPDKSSSSRSRPMSANSWSSSLSKKRLPDTLEILGIDKLTEQFESLTTQNDSLSKNNKKAKHSCSKQKSFSQESSDGSLKESGSSTSKPLPEYHNDRQIEFQKHEMPTSEILNSGTYPACDMNNIGTFEVNESSNLDETKNGWEDDKPSLNLIISPVELLSIDGNSILQVNSNTREDSGSDFGGLVVAPGDLSGDDFTDSASISSLQDSEQIVEDISFLASQQDAENNNVEFDNHRNQIFQPQINSTTSNFLEIIPITSASPREKTLEADCRMQENREFPVALQEEANAESVICSTLTQLHLPKHHSSSDETINLIPVSLDKFDSKESTIPPEKIISLENSKKLRHRKKKKKSKKDEKDAVFEIKKHDFTNLKVEEVMKHPLWENFIQKTGKIIYIMERKHSCVSAGYLKLNPDKNRRWALFSPIDSRIPRIMVPMSDCPQNFYSRPLDYANFLFLVRIVDWDDSSKFAFGHLVKSLGNSNDVEVQTEGILASYDVDCTDFPASVLACLPQTETWKVPEEEIKSRRDLRKECVFTIDPATARDMDDAVSCKILENGNFEVGVHIADVTYFVREGTELDKFSQSRSTSVYLVQKVIPMLPRKLCDDLCSLNPFKDRLTFSVIWEISPDADIVQKWFGRTVINSCVKLSYEHAQSIIESSNKSIDKKEFPDIMGGFTICDVSKRILQLNNLAMKLRKRRFDSGALRLDQHKLQFTLNTETGLPVGISSFIQKDSNRLIEEFMLLANMSVANEIYRVFPNLALLRRHPPPQSRALQQVISVCESLGIVLDGNSSGALQKSIEHYVGEDFVSKARTDLLMNLLSKPMNRAIYFCSGVLEDQSSFHHYALNVPFYTHFTSPIRRYPDIVVHRLLGACLEYNNPPNMESAEINRCAVHCNDKKYNAKLVSEASAELFLATFIRELGSLSVPGMVVGVMDHSFDCLLLNMAIVKRVYCDKLPLQKKTFLRSHGVSTLNLIWKEDGLEQVLVVFAHVDLLLTVEDSLKIRATLKKPNM